MKRRSILFLFNLLLPLLTIAQIEFSLDLAADGETYIVYARPLANTAISTNIIVGTGQVTIITPTGFQLKNATNLGGQWDDGQTVIRGPLEDPLHDYFSFGLIADNNPKAVFKPDVATALFSFQSKEGCQGVIRLINNIEDDFAMLPNSINSNPGNVLGIIDLGNGLTRHQYIGNDESNMVDCSNNNPSSNDSPSLNNPTIEILTTKSAAIRWEAKENVIDYEVQVRVSNTTKWLATLRTKVPKVFLYVPEIQVYEYQITTKLADGTSELGDILEVNLIGNN